MKITFLYKIFLVLIFSSLLILFLFPLKFGLNQRNFKSFLNLKKAKNSQIIVNHRCNKSAVAFDNQKALNAVKNNLEKNLASFRACEINDLPFLSEQPIVDIITNKNIFKICLINFTNKYNDSICTARYFTKKMNVHESAGNLNFSKEIVKFKLNDEDICTYLNKSNFLFYDYIFSWSLCDCHSLSMFEINLNQASILM